MKIDTRHFLKTASQLGASRTRKRRNLRSVPRNLKALATVQEQEPDLKKQFAFKLEPLELRMYRLNPNNKKRKTYLKLKTERPSPGSVLL